MQVFEYSLHKSLPDTNLAKRLRNISDTHTFNVYNYGCTGIFEKHKLLFSFQITLKLKIDEGQVSVSLSWWDSLVRYNVSVWNFYIPASPAVRSVAG